MCLTMKNKIIFLSFLLFSNLSLASQYACRISYRTESGTRVVTQSQYANLYQGEGVIFSFLPAFDYKPYNVDNVDNVESKYKDINRQRDFNAKVVVQLDRYLNTLRIAAIFRDLDSSKDLGSKVVVEKPIQQSDFSLELPSQILNESNVSLFVSSVNISCSDLDSQMAAKAKVNSDQISLKLIGRPWLTETLIAKKTRFSTSNGQVATMRCSEDLFSFEKNSELVLSISDSPVSAESVLARVKTNSLNDCQLSINSIRNEVVSGNQVELILSQKQQTKKRYDFFYTKIGKVSVQK